MPRKRHLSPVPFRPDSQMVQSFMKSHSERSEESRGCSLDRRCLHHGSDTIPLFEASMIETERLRLRRWREADLPAFAAMNADPMVRRYFSSRLTREESDASVSRFIRMYALDGYAFM